MPPPNPTGVDQLQKGLRLGECLQALVLLHVPPDLPPLLGMGRGRIAHPPHMQRSALGRKGKTKLRFMFPPTGSVFWGLFLSASPLSRCFLRGMSTGGPTMAKHPPFPDSSMGNSVAVERCWERSPCSGAVPPSFSSFFLSFSFNWNVIISFFIRFLFRGGGGRRAGGRAQRLLPLHISPTWRHIGWLRAASLQPKRTPPPAPIPAQTLPFCPVPRFKANPAGKGVAGGPGGGGKAPSAANRSRRKSISFVPSRWQHTHTPPPPPPPPLFFFSFLFVFFFFFFAFNPFFFHADGAGGWWGAEPMGCIAWV